MTDSTKCPHVEKPFHALGHCPICNAKPTPDETLAAWHEEARGEPIHRDNINAINMRSLISALREAISQRDLALSERNTVSRLCNLRADERDLLTAKLAELTEGGPRQPDGSYRPSRIEVLESDREERDYYQAMNAVTRAKLEVAVEALIHYDRWLSDVAEGEPARAALAEIGGIK